MNGCFLTGKRNDLCVQLFPKRGKERGFAGAVNPLNGNNHVFYHDMPAGLITIMMRKLAARTNAPATESHKTIPSFFRLITSQLA